MNQPLLLQALEKLRQRRSFNERRVTRISRRMEPLEDRTVPAAPIAFAGGPYYSSNDSFVVLSGSGTDPDNDIVGYAWDLDNNGTFETKGKTVNLPLDEFPSPSIWTINFRVTDATGQFDIDSTTLNVGIDPPDPNQSPTVTTGSTLYVINEGESLELTASGFDPDGDELSFSWDLDNDGTFETDGQNIFWNDIASKDGPYGTNVKVKVDDGKGGTAIATAGVQVQNVAPELSIEQLTLGEAGLPTTFRFSASDASADDANGTFTYFINWGDGSSSEVVSGAVLEFNHTYAMAGEFEISAQVGDDDGGLSEVTLATALIQEVENLSPTIDAIPQVTVNEGNTIFLTANGQDPEGDVLDYGWDLDGDGYYETAGQNVSIAGNLVESGMYEFAVRATDSAGNSGYGTAVVNVLNVGPKVSVTGPATGNAGKAYTFTFSATDPSAQDTAAGFNYTVTWGDGTSQQVAGNGPIQLSHTFAKAGTVAITVVANDRDHGNGRAEHKFNAVDAVVNPGDHCKHKHHHGHGHHHHGDHHKRLGQWLEANGFGKVQQKCIGKIVREFFTHHVKQCKKF